MSRAEEILCLLEQAVTGGGTIGSSGGTSGSSGPGGTTSTIGSGNGSKASVQSSKNGKKGKSVKGTSKPVGVEKSNDDDDNDDDDKPGDSGGDSVKPGVAVHRFHYGYGRRCDCDNPRSRACLLWCKEKER